MNARMLTRKLVAAGVAAAVFWAALAPHRAAAIDAIWDGATVGLWSNAANWSSDPLVPNNGVDQFDVFIDDVGAEVDVDVAFTIRDFNWSAGAVIGAGELTVEGQTTISGADEKKFSGVTVNLEGDTLWSEGSIGSVEPVEGGVVNNSGTFDIAWDSFWGWNDDHIPVVNNLVGGTVLKTAGEGDALFWSEFNNAGMVHLQSGGLYLSGGGLSTGTFLADENTSLRFSDFSDGFSAAGALTTTLDVDSVIDSAGTVRFDQALGNARIDAYGTIDAAVVEANPGPGGLVLFHDSSLLGSNVRGSLVAYSGTTAFDNAPSGVVDVIVNDASSINLVNGAAMSVSGAINVNEGGVLNVGDATTGGSVHMDDAMAPQLLTGAGEIVMGNLSSSIDASHQLTIDEELTVRGRGQITGAGGVASNGQNLGTLRADVMGAALRTVSLDNAGTFEGIGGGTVDFRSATNTGTITVAGGGNLVVTNAVNRATMSINAGTLELNGNDWDNVAGQGTITATNASILLRGDFTFAELGDDQSH